MVQSFTERSIAIIIRSKPLRQTARSDEELRNDGDWRQLLGARDRSVLARAGYGHPVGLGKRPALLVVDTTYGFTGRERLPIDDSIREYPSSCGLVAWDAVGLIQRLLSAARVLRVPVVYSRGSGEPTRAGRWLDKRPNSLRQPSDSYEIVAEIAPLPSEPVLRKHKPSAFFGTQLAEALDKRGLDSLIVVGGTTSGCIRATVLDAFSHDLRVTVVEDAVFDRVELSHKVALLEFSQKYADVRPAADILEELERRQTKTPAHVRAQ